MLVLASVISVILAISWSSRGEYNAVTTLTCVPSYLNITQTPRTILTWNKSFYLWIHCVKEVSLCFKFHTNLFTHFLKMLLEICEGTKKDTCQKFECNTFLVGVDFWATIQEAGQVRRVEAASVPLALWCCSKEGEVCELLSIWQLSQAITVSVVWLRGSDR